MSDGKRLGIYGRSGSGKTTLMNELVMSVSHLIVFDAMRTRREHMAGLGLSEVTTIEMLRDGIADGYGQGVRLWYRPPADSYQQIAALHEMSRLIWAIQISRYDAGKPLAPLTVAVDEMSDCFPVDKLPRDQMGFARLCKQGRHYRINLVGASQRPAQINTEFRGNLDERFFFSLKEPADLKAVQSTAGAGVADRVAALPPYRYIRMGPAGVSEGKTAA